MALRTVSYDAKGKITDDKTADIDKERAVLTLVHAIANKAADVKSFYVHYVFPDGTSHTHIVADTIEELFKT